MKKCTKCGKLATRSALICHNCGEDLPQHGGRRSGAGRPAGSRTVDEPRTLRKQIRWTEREWTTVEQAAAEVGLDVAAYQRARILGAKYDS